MIVFGYRGLEMSGEVNAACIASVCILNTTDSCFMAAMVESPSCENGELGAGFLKACASCFAASMEFSTDDKKRMVK